MTNKFPENHPRNRPSVLLDKSFNEFGFSYPNNRCSMGSKGDVHTFFLVLNDLINDGALEDSFPTITHHLYKTLVNERNITDYEAQLPELLRALSHIRSDKVDWDKYPFQREIKNPYRKSLPILVSSDRLIGVFERFIKPLEEAPFWINRYLERDGKDFSRLVVGPMALKKGSFFKQYKDTDFLDAENDPLWLRVPE